MSIPDGIEILTAMKGDVEIDRCCHDRCLGAKEKGNYPSSLSLQLSFGLILLHHGIGHNTALDLSSSCLGHDVGEVDLQEVSTKQTW